LGSGREGLGDAHQVEQAIAHRVHSLMIGANGPTLKSSLWGAESDPAGAGRVGVRIFVTRDGV
jgi:hypothetical protein